MSAVSMHRVHKEYGDVVALDGLELQVAPGDVVALLGPNGAGKSTVFELLLGLIRPSYGTIRVLGQEPGSRVRHRAGAMLQSAGLPEQATVREVVRLVAGTYPMPLGVGEVLTQVALGHRASAVVARLSGGERQRLLLALALVGAPELLLLDEPTAAMDVAARRRFWEQTRASVSAGATVLFATHDLNEAAAVADRVLVLQHGRLLADTTTDELTDHGREDVEEVFLTLTAEDELARNDGELR